MKITMYELLGMIKDGKAPKKVKYREMIYHICYEYGDYESDIEEYRDADTKEHYYLFEDIDMLKCLNDEVEIIEKKKIPKKINNGYTKQSIEDMKEARFNSNDMAKICNRIGWLMENRNELSNKIDEIIDYLKSKGE